MGKSFQKLFPYVVQRDFILMEIRAANYVMEEFLTSIHNKSVVLIMKFLISKLKNALFVMEILIKKESCVALTINLLSIVVQELLPVLEVAR